jgi:FAD dependent oxidoreductase TIGR03364
LLNIKNNALDIFHKPLIIERLHYFTYFHNYLIINDLTNNPKLGTRNPKLGTRNPKLGTRNLKLMQKNSMTKKIEIAIIGAGIVGLAHALSFARRGHQVRVFERNLQAVGASVRNFGMVWPIGQPAGKLFHRAMLSRQIWLEFAAETGIYANPCGSLLPFYTPEEQAVVEEFYQAKQPSGYQIDLLSPQSTLKQCELVNPKNLRGGLWSETEVIVDPREAIARLPIYLQAKYGVEFHFGKTVTAIQAPYLQVAGEQWQADKILICSGADFETLYPALFQANQLTKCKLQMLRTTAQTAHLNTALYGGLTLTHYNSFADCPSLPQLKQKFETEMPEYSKWGIHVMICQNGSQEWVIGDSHEYGLNPEPFDKTLVNQLILSYLQTFTQLPDFEIAQTWHGVYPKLFGKTDLLLQPEANVHIINGLGGAGMTLSFGLAEENYTIF